MKGPLRVYVLAYLAFLYAPIALLPLFAFNNSTIIAFPLEAPTLRWFAELGHTPALGAALGNSLLIAVLASGFATLLALAAARAATGRTFPGRQGILAFLMLPLVLPEIVLAVSLLVVTVQVFGWPLSRWTIVAAHTLLALPFALAILRSAFDHLDPAIEEAAIDLGRTRFGAFSAVMLPVIWPGVLSALLVGFTISLDEFIVAFFLSGAEPTLPVYIWGLLRFPSRLPVVMALGTLLVLASLCLLVLAEILRRRSLARIGHRP
ncbi:MAG: ABC transporter permease [Pseudomonadota bacterium]